MMKDYKQVCTLKENGNEFIIYHDLEANKYYKEDVDGNLEELSIKDIMFYMNVEKINDKIIEDKQDAIFVAKVRKACRFTCNATFALLISSLMITAGCRYYRDNEPKRIYNHSEKTTEDAMQLFASMAEKNPKINGECADDIMTYLKVFVDECNNLGIDNDDVYMKIAKNLRLIDLSNRYSINYSDLCELFNFKNGSFVAAHLYAYLNDKNLNSKYLDIANILYFSEEAKGLVLSGEKLKIDLGGETFKVDLTDLDNNDDRLYELIDKFVKQQLEVRNNDSCTCSCNLFSPLLEEKVRSLEVVLYYELQEDGTLQDVSYREYYKKLANLIYTEGDELDYSNETDRALVYIYADALSLNFGYQWSDDLPLYILNTYLASDDLLIPVIGKYELLRYLNGDRLDISSLVNFWDIAIMGEESLGFVQELNRCLKTEVSLGNLSQDAYDYFIHSVVQVIEILYPERLEEFKDANLYNRSMEGFKLELVPHYNL